MTRTDRRRQRAGTPSTARATAPSSTIAAAGYAWTNDDAYALHRRESGQRQRRQPVPRDGQGAQRRPSCSEIEERGRGIPFFNTIAADRRGRALRRRRPLLERPEDPDRRLHAAGLPADRTFQQREADHPRRLAVGLHSRRPPAGERDAAPCAHDYVENSNDSYWLANPRAPITGITPLIGLERTIQGIRTRCGQPDGSRAFWQAAAASRSAALQRLCAERPQLPGAARLAPARGPLHAPTRRSPSRTGDRSTSARPARSSTPTTTPATSTARRLAVRRLPAARPGRAAFWADSFDPADPLNHAESAQYANPATAARSGEAVQELRDNGIALDSGMRGVQVATRGTPHLDPRLRQLLPEHQLLERIQRAANAPYGEVMQGSSMVLTTELRKRGPTRGHPHLLAGDRPDLPLVQEHDRPLLAQAVGEAAVHAQPDPEGEADAGEAAGRLVRGRDRFGGQLEQPECDRRDQGLGVALRVIRGQRERLDGRRPP